MVLVGSMDREDVVYTSVTSGESVTAIGDAHRPGNHCRPVWGDTMFGNFSGRGVSVPVVVLACCLAVGVQVFADGLGDTGKASGADCCRAARQGQQQTARTSASNSSNTIDVVSYTLTMRIDFAAERITARCDVGLRSLVDGLGYFALDFVGLTASRVVEEGFQGQVGFTTGGGVIEITPSSPLAAGEERVYQISYSGSPQRGMYFRSHNNGICYTFTEPEDSRYWFPCRDLPSDKADWYQAHITAPSAFLVAGNGTLESVSSNGDGTRTHHYHMAQPVSTYLISLAVSNFDTFSQTASGGLPITHYVYPSHYDRAVYDWANIPAMIDFYSSVYGDYPFDSYGMAMAPMGGAMEHQTMTTFGSGLVNGNRFFEPIVAHELAHQWWGDLVTCRNWAEIWLNEGFATYFDALFTEHFYGPEAFRAQMADNRRSYFNREPGEGRFPIYDPDYMWGVTVYEKGAWILHMLRQVLGTSTWQEGVRVYADRHRYGTATTPDLISAFEDVSGADLDWFFDQWVYQAGYPEFKYTHGGYPAGEGGYTMTIAFRQVQQNAPIFRMPLEVGVTTAAGTTLHRVEVNGEYSSFDLDLDGPPAEVVIDPEVWALAGWTYVDLTGDVDGSGRVDGIDNSRLAWSFGSGVGGDRWFAPADLNGDGVVDGQDLALLASNFGNSL